MNDVIKFIELTDFLSNSKTTYFVGSIYSLTRDKTEVDGEILYRLFVNKESHGYVYKTEKERDKVYNKIMKTLHEH